MKIILDNIIFSLQKSGGISVVWNELLSRILMDPEFNVNFIDFPTDNIFRKNLCIQKHMLLNNSRSFYPIPIQRYLSPKVTEKGIFHSSYYRTSDSENIINITTVHDFTYEYFRSGLPKIVHHIQKENSIKKSKRIICVSQNTKMDLLKFFPEFKDYQIKVIYNGVSESYFNMEQKDEAALKQLIHFPRLKFALYIGDRMSPYKNFRLAVEACKIINIPLVMVGGGSLTKKEKIMLYNSMQHNMFIQLSGISNEQLNHLYNNALCLIYPSVYEGFGIPVLEAQRSGCPVICSTNSSLPEVAGDGAVLLERIDITGIVNSIELLRSDYSFRNDIIRKGLINSRRFSWNKNYQQIKELYKEVYQENF
jgi:glycosyltransferase involved in cell wall biosynthesis